MPTSLAMNAAGDMLVFQDEKSWALMHLDKNVAITRLQTNPDARKSAVSNDRRYVAIANWAGGAAVWDGKSGTHLSELSLGSCGVMQFSPDGQVLAATPDGVTLWRTKNWQRIEQLHAHGTTPMGLGIAFSPDSRVLAIGQVNGVLGLFDSRTGKELANRRTGFGCRFNLGIHPRPTLANNLVSGRTLSGSNVGPAGLATGARRSRA